jgi:hypothetical protein
MLAEKKDLQNELNELKTKIALAEERLQQLEDIPTYEKTENMIKNSLDDVPNEDKILVMIQESIRKENLVTDEVVEKKLTKLKLWLYVTVVGLVGLGFKLFI